MVQNTQVKAERELVRPRRELDRSAARVRQWVLDHRGALRVVADEAGVSHQFVHQIAYRRAGARSGGLRVERMLRDLGCPGIRVR
jgi:hypothetical protein